MFCYLESVSGVVVMLNIDICSSQDIMIKSESVLVEALEQTLLIRLSEVTLFHRLELDR